MSTTSFFSSSGSTTTVEDTIDTSVELAEAAKDAAEAAQAAAETAKTASETAKVGSVSAQALSESARDSALTYKTQAESARDTTLGYRDSAETYKDAAATSATSAAGSLSSVQASAAAAATSESNAATSETNSAASQVAAAASAASASSSASSASTDAATASTKASEASTSAANAATSESNSASSASSSSTSAAASASSATSASNAQTAAETAKTAAETAKVAAEAAQTAAETAETNSAASASSSASSASSSASSATSSASSATSAANAQTASETAQAAAETAQAAAETAESNSAASATSSAASASTATTKAGEASTSAANAASSASAAASSASSASSAQSAAESARDSALAAYDSFDDRYLGVFTTANTPTTDNDGNTLVAGSLFFDSTAGAMKVYTGSAWVAAYISGDGYAPLTGATFTGNVTVPNLVTSGQVDGRDVSADGTKLDGIESGATADQTASEILTAIKTVDGASSGLDADLLDGQQGSYYLNADNFSNMPSGYSGWTISDGTNSESIADGNTLTVSGSGATTASYNTSTNTLTISSTDNNTTYSNATTSASGLMSSTDKSKLNGIESGATADQTASEILTAIKTVDGSGSGLDADTLDGQQGSYYYAASNPNGYTTNVGDITGVTAGTGLSGGGASGSVTLNVDLSELTDMTATMVGTDEFIVLDAGADRRKAASEIGLSIFNNDAGFTTNVGDITGVTAGTNLTGGGTSGTVTLNMATGGVGAGTYGSTSNQVKIDTITVDAYGRVTAVATGGCGDITGVTAGTNLSGGGTSGTVTLNVVASPTFTTVNATTVDLGNWTITESSGVLYFATGGTNKMKLDASGNLTVVGDVTAFGSV